MPRSKVRPTLADVKALLAEDRDFLRPLVQDVLQELLEAEMTGALDAGKGERTPLRLGYRSGYYGRTLITRVGKLELRVPQDRTGRFSTELFARYQRSEKALVAALAEMDVQGVSTRKVKAITEELCGHSFCGSPRPRACQGSSSWSRTTMPGSGRRSSRCCRRRPGSAVELVLGPACGRTRGCTSCATRSTTCRARSTTTACASCAGWELVLGRSSTDPGDRRDLGEARRDLAAWLAKWRATYAKLCGWVEEHVEETLTFYRLPRQHHKHLKSTNLLERLNEEIKRRTHVVRIFPNAESCLRLVRALAVEMHENWLEAHRYLNMDDLREHKKEALRMAA